MPKNTKPMLTVLVDADKLQQFRDYAATQKVSMGYLVNGFIDMCLSYPINGESAIAFPGAESLPECEPTSTAIEEPIETPIEEISRVKDVEETLKVYREGLEERPTLEAVRRLIASAIEESEEQTKEAIFHLHSAIADDWADAKTRISKQESEIENINKKLNTFEKNNNNNIDGIRNERGATGEDRAREKSPVASGIDRQNPSTLTSDSQISDYAKSTNLDPTQADAIATETPIRDDYKPRIERTPEDRKVDTMTWRNFHTHLNLHAPTKAYSGNAEIALYAAAKRGELDWHYDATKKQFWKELETVELIFPN